MFHAPPGCGGRNTILLDTLTTCFQRGRCSQATSKNPETLANAGTGSSSHRLKQALAHRLTKEWRKESVLRAPPTNLIGCSKKMLGYRPIVIEPPRKIVVKPYRGMPE